MQEDQLNLHAHKPFFMHGPKVAYICALGDTVDFILATQASKVSLLQVSH
jgi:hypothetical protein